MTRDAIEPNTDQISLEWVEYPEPFVIPDSVYDFTYEGHLRATWDSPLGRCSLVRMWRDNPLTYLEEEGLKELFVPDFADALAARLRRKAS